MRLRTGVLSVFILIPYVEVDTELTLQSVGAIRPAPHCLRKSAAGGRPFWPGWSLAVPIVQASGQA